MIYDYKYRPQPEFPNKPMNIKTQSIPNILDEIFAPFVADTVEYRTYTGKKSEDGTTYTFAFEIPRLVRDTIAVEIEEDLKNTSPARRIGMTSYKITIKAAQQLLVNYLDETQESAKKKYEQEFVLHGQSVALDGELGLSYSEGVLVVEIPLTKPVQPKKATLSAKLADIEST